MVSRKKKKNLKIEILKIVVTKMSKKIFFEFSNFNSIFGIKRQNMVIF